MHALQLRAKRGEADFVEVGFMVLERYCAEIPASRQVGIRQFPDELRRERGVAVHVEPAIFVTPGEMDFLHCIEIKRLQISDWVRAAVADVNKKVMQVEQCAAQPLVVKPAQKFWLAEIEVRNWSKEAAVLQQHTATERCCQAAELRGD